MRDSAEPIHLTLSPGWLDLATLRAMAQAKDHALALAHDASSAAEAVYVAARAHHPALPTSMLVEGAAAVLAAGSQGKGPT